MPRSQPARSINSPAINSPAINSPAINSPAINSGSINSSSINSPAITPNVAVLRDICRAVLAFRSEPAVLKLAEQVVARYPRLDAAERSAFFAILLRDFGPDVDAVRKAVEVAQRDGFDPASLSSLWSASESRRQELFRRINTAPGATHTLVTMRADLLRELDAEPALSVVDADLSHLLRSWFGRGFLTLERISWESPAAVLERLVAYEAVHAVRSWVDLRRRLAPDRRCYGFFHPALPGEPLIFIEIALTHGPAANVHDVLDQPNPTDDAPPADADTAVFYSITNCQAGLAGIAFGDLLIKQVAHTIATELPQITTFATLSPVPGFGAWLSAQRVAPELLPGNDAATLQALDTPGWEQHADAALVDALRRAAARFLVHAKSGRQPRDPVARFHLRNGATLARIHALADTSSKGLAESFTVMVSYQYDEATLMANHEAFVAAGEIACSPEVRELAS